VLETLHRMSTTYRSIQQGIPLHRF